MKLHLSIISKKVCIIRNSLVYMVTPFQNLVRRCPYFIKGYVQQYKKKIFKSNSFREIQNYLSLFCNASINYLFSSRQFCCCLNRKKSPCYAWRRAWDIHRICLIYAMMYLFENLDSYSFLMSLQLLQGDKYLFNEARVL